MSTRFDRGSETLYMSSLSLEFVKVDVTERTGLDLSEFPVALALVAEGTDPTGPDWESAEWNDAGTEARLLVGPGGSEISKGDYRIWARITANPEVPVIKAGRVVIF